MHFLGVLDYFWTIQKRSPVHLDSGFKKMYNFIRQFAKMLLKDEIQERFGLTFVGTLQRHSRQPHEDFAAKEAKEVSGLHRVSIISVAYE